MTEGAHPDGDGLPQEPAAGTGEPAARQERLYPSTIGGVFYLCVLLATAVGIGIVVSGNWRLGIRWLASSLLVAAALRLVLPQRDAGMLAVRHRLFDCALLTVVGAALYVLAETIPEQPL